MARRQPRHVLAASRRWLRSIRCVRITEEKRKKEEQPINTHLAHGLKELQFLRVALHSDQIPVDVVHIEGKYYRPGCLGVIQLLAAHRHNVLIVYLGQPAGGLQGNGGEINGEKIDVGIA